MVEIFLAYTFAKDIASTTSNRTGVLTFCALIFILYAIHRFVPLFKNAFTESVTLSVSIIATLICFCSASANAFIPEFITGVIASLIVASYVLHKNKVIQTFAGFKAPILPAVMTARASSMLAPALGIKDTAAVNTVCWSIFALILIIAAALLVYLPKLAFAFHAEHQRKTDTALYVNMAVAGIILMALPFSGSLIFIPAALCFIHFAVSNKLPANITAVLPSLAFLGAISEFLKNNKADSLVTSIVIMSAFCVYMGISRLFYSSSVISSREGKITIDPMLFSGWLAPMLMYKELTRTSIFFAVIALAVYCAAFIKKNTSHTTASILLTITTALTSAALIFRPFFVPDSAAVSSKITLAIIAAAGLACRFIWNKYPEASRYSSQGIFLTAFIALLIDALYFDTALNTIFVMSVMLFVLIVSIMAHSKTWFTASAVSLFTITIYATREYLMALDWWIYLFLAGLTLIVLAAVNEYCKKNNETLKTSVARKFSGWTW